MGVHTADIYFKACAKMVSTSVGLILPFWNATLVSIIFIPVGYAQSRIFLLLTI